MSDTKLIQEVLDKVSSIDDKVNTIDNRVNSIDKKVDRGFSELREGIFENGKRIDKIGLQLAELEDDAPTREEHNELESRVDKLENRAIPA